MKNERAAAVALLAILALQCSSPQERSVLDRFFSSSRLRDKTALADVATVLFEPLEQGIVTRFEIVRVTDPKDGVKIVRVRAPVKMPDGQVVEKNLDMTLERHDGRWVVTAF
jgi:hypothetical protein